MKKLKKEIDEERAIIEEIEELEEEESEDEEEEKEEVKLDEFEIMKMKVRAKMPKKIAAKGIISDLRPIEEDSMDEMSFSEIKIKKNEFDEMTNDQKREQIESIMKNPTFEEVIEKAEGENPEEMPQEQSDEIQKKLGITYHHL